MSVTRWTVYLSECPTELTQRHDDLSMRGLGIGIYDEVAARYLYDALVKAGEPVELRRDQADEVVASASSAPKEPKAHRRWRLLPDA
jgi:hypothetical protein